MGWPEDFNDMRNDLQEKATAVGLIVEKYMKGGTHHAVFEKLLALRHERLAHRQLAPATATGANATDEEIEEFYQDNSKLIRHLLSVVNAMAYDPQDTANIYSFYASQFWGAFQRTEDKAH